MTAGFKMGCLAGALSPEIEHDTYMQVIVKPCFRLSAASKLTDMRGKTCLCGKMYLIYFLLIDVKGFKVLITLDKAF